MSWGPETPEAVKAAVKRGIGLGILYRDLVETDIRTGDLTIIRVPGLKMDIDSYIIYHREKVLSAHAKDFLALLRERTR
jgi:DNA-binding transcriptional LysR family regulator